ncbi:hypothetical protein QWZ06_01120 [Chryseobacterium tructae]|uniref:YD repeat-containing protein n=1 Tax=Chryseobacterium tructae TaxID=1037380 RepID=A0ABV7XSF1_9FLAO|nr:hypothetical protein [Chryseobacterium tructae]MDN3690966.1 hypothetical protein [Chryseobacterium tructae]
MKHLLFILSFLSTYFNSQIIKDTVLGKPKFVKEYVVFLNESSPFTFMTNDSEYGHAVIMTPDNLRKRMRDTWFETDFCRDINNETYYDKKRNIINEIWYYRSGKIVDDYNYTYDRLNRLTSQSSKGYSERTYLYFYDGNNKTAKFSELYYKGKDEPMEKYTNNLESFKPLYTTKFDSITKTDSIFAITNDIWKKVEKGYTMVKDSVYRKKLSQVKIYNNQYKVIESKAFNYTTDFENKEVYLSEHFKYDYDELGNLIKRTNIEHGKYHNYGRTYYTVYTYTKDQKLEKETIYRNDKVWFETRFEYNGNYITKLYYLDKFGVEDKEVEPVTITFKYTFDKDKNWIKIIKNVDGKDLYKWIRKIEYY